VVTVGLILDAREGRRDLEQARVAGLFRAALVEGVENCQPWARASTGLSVPLERLKEWRPRFDALHDLLGSADLPGELGAYVVWEIAMVREDYEPMPLDPQLGGPTTQFPAREARMVILDRLQTLVCLLGGEARRQGFDESAEAFRQDAQWSPWLKPEVWPQEKNRSFSAQGQTVYRMGPGGPTNPAYAGCSPQARDMYANQLFAAQQDWMMEPARDLMQRLRPH